LPNLNLTKILFGHKYCFKQENCLFKAKTSQMLHVVRKRQVKLFYFCKSLCPIGPFCGKTIKDYFIALGLSADKKGMEAMKSLQNTNASL